MKKLILTKIQFLPTTVISKEQSFLLPTKLVAKHVTAVIPIGKALPLGGVHSLCSENTELSLAVVFHSTFAVGNPGSVNTVTFSEQLMSGISLSTNNENTIIKISSCFLEIL